jgi:SAM-dependent methyltransferase
VDSGLIRRLVEDNGRPMNEMSAILDFACGCGRIARCWGGLDGPQLYGCDYDPRLTAWCQSNLAGIEVRTNGASPPLPFEPSTFDLVYAISLFTHLSAGAHTAWMRDVHRVLKPGGLFLFTAHGERFAPRLDDEQRARFAAGELVVLYPEISSQQNCAAFHPKAFVRDRLLPEAGLELVDAVYEDRSDGHAASPLPLQDNYLARRPR